MTPSHVLSAPAGGVVQRRFSRPQPGAARRMGIYRVAFAVFYLWHLSLFDLSLIAGIPDDYRVVPLWFNRLLPTDPTVGQLRVLDGLLVALLVLLAVGWRTRAVTVAVLVAGLYREGLLAGFSVEDGNVFLVAFIPLFMAAAGDWGRTYSLDERRRRADSRSSDPPDDGWSALLPARASLVLLAFLFTTSALFKARGKGPWLRETDFLTDLMLERGVTLAWHGWAANPLAPWFADHAWAGTAMQFGVLAFEATFLLVLVGGEVRRFYLSMALVFHALNAFLLAVTFSQIVVLYGLFAATWLEPLRLRRPDRLLRLRRALPAPRPAIETALALGVAVALALAWRAGAADVVSVGGRLDWRSMWILVLPLALASAAVAAVRLGRSALTLGRRAQPPLPGTIR